jgi:hypothetical protein
VPLEHARDRPSIRSAPQPPQRVENRQIRLPWSALLHALAPRHARAGARAGHRGDERFHQRRLSDARLTGEEDDMALAGPGRLEQLREPLELVGSSDQAGGGERTERLGLFLGSGCAAQLDRRPRRSGPGGPDGLPHHLDVRHEPEAAAPHGADDALRRAVVAHGLAGGLDAAAQGGRGDEAMAPDLVQQLVPRDEPLPVLEQMAQHVEDLGLDGAHLASPAELALARVQLAVAEGEGGA